jgi:hypothetical protein
VKIELNGGKNNPSYDASQNFYNAKNSLRKVGVSLSPIEYSTTLWIRRILRGNAVLDHTRQLTRDHTLARQTTIAAMLGTTYVLSEQRRGARALFSSRSAFGQMQTGTEKRAPKVENP